MLTQEIEKVIHKYIYAFYGEWSREAYEAEERVRNQLLELFKKVLPTEEEIKNIGIDLVEEFFPKGKCKERGQAIVLYAQLIIKFDQALKEIKEKLK